ncbi:MAG: type II secretion system protein GspD [Armatimonadetes bacterium]|nr:type II secretion system protein GspD [Armatimonadota bacterium]
MAAALSGAQTQSSDSISMVFSNTEVGVVLKALGLRTGANIIYVAGKDKVTVSLSVKVKTTEEAVQSVASSAGLAYRKVGTMFVVASPSNMRQALEPYCETALYTLKVGKAADISPKLQDHLPFATITLKGAKVQVKGLPEDLSQARSEIDEYQADIVARQEVTDVVLLDNMSATEMQPLLEGLYPDVKFSATKSDKEAGALGLSGPKGMVDMAKQTITKLDAGRSAGPNAVVYRVYELKYTSGPSISEFLKAAMPDVEVFTGPESYIPRRAVFNPISALLNSGSSTSLIGGNSGNQQGSQQSSQQNGGNNPNELPIKVGDRAKSIVLKGRASSVEDSLKLIAELDKKPKQIVVEVNVIETTPETNQDTGMLYNWSPFDFVEVPPGTTLAHNPGGQVTTDPVTTRPAGLGQFSRVPSSFRAILSAMVTNKTAKILARPKIDVVDNGNGSVFIGDTIRALVTTQGQLGAQNVQIQEFPVGIILLIAPRVNSDGNITLHVNPIVSAVTSIGDNNVPQTSVREADTTVIVKSGETIVLGGLIRDSDVKTIQEVPFLSKLPIIGELFKRRTSSHSRTDIIVSITPHMVSDDPKSPDK